jgi:hypothetical protein
VRQEVSDIGRGGRTGKFRGFPRPGVVKGIFAALLLLSGCLNGENSKTTGGDASGTTNRPPVVKSASIVPNPLTLATAPTVRVEAQDLDLNTISFRYRWHVNGQVLAGQIRESISPELLKRGDQVTVVVTPFDGTIEGASFMTEKVVVENAAPVVSRIDLDFDRTSGGRHVTATVDVADPDHDTISLTYRWKKNEEVLREGKSNRLELVGLTARDAMQLDVVATDGMPGEPTVATERFTLSNSVPAIVSRPPSTPVAGQYAYVVQATDPDGDSIAYTLEAGPPGMSIDPKTGRINWVPSPEARGAYTVRIVAKDSQGGFASQEFELSLAKPAAES